MTGGQVLALLCAIVLLVPGGCFLIVGIGSLAEGSSGSGVAALQIGVPIVAVVVLLFWVALRRRPPSPPGPGGSSS
jgi:membrane protein implicated in regulation of membrane protease activity